MARIILGASPARRLVIEIAYVAGRRPSQQAVDHLRTILERETSKPDGVRPTFGAELPTTRSSYSLNNLLALEQRYRRLHSSGEVATIWIAALKLALEQRYRRLHSNGEVATIWIAALNGDYAGGSGTLGLAFTATAFALFEDQIQQAANVFVSADSIERSVITHEMGHLLGLVNIGYRSHYDHEDPQHPHHSKYQTSVMYWAVEDTSIATILRGGPPDDFDRYDRADLALLRGR